MPSPPLIKPHLEYPELVARLKERGMIIPDEARAIRKLSQIGYYRLSGFLHSLAPEKRTAYPFLGSY